VISNTSSSQIKISTKSTTSIEFIKVNKAEANQIRIHLVPLRYFTQEQDRATQ
jgi:hypothetical protein